MKTWNSLTKSGLAAGVIFAGVLVLATGCVEERVVMHAPPAYPVPARVPEPLPPPPVVIPPPQVVQLPPVPPPAPVVMLRSAADLDRMLGPVALYPDPLLAQLLPAATLPEQVVLADRYLREGGDVNIVDAQPWDNSIKALARYPSTLRMLDENLAWTTDLGRAFLNQPTDVMNSIQRLRAQAHALGNLQSTSQQTVVFYGGVIEILPPAPQVIYVPVYQPELVYVQRPAAPGRFYISFSAGFVAGAWLNHDCDWHDHEIIVWHHDHPRPVDWWFRAPERRDRPFIVNNVTVVNNTTIGNNNVVNENVTVWRPRPRGAVADRGDRGWGAQQARMTLPSNHEAAKPQRVEVRQQADTVKPAREVGMTQREVAQPSLARPNPPVETVKPMPARPVRETPSANDAMAAPVRSQEQARAGSPPASASAPENQRAERREPTAFRPARERSSNQPVAAPKDPRQAAGADVVRHPSSASNGQRIAAPPAAAPARVANGTLRPPSSALAGIENSQATRAASVRGQQSRQTISNPAAAARPASAPVPSPRGNSGQTKKPQQVHEN